jgi:hypothetical protein
MYHMRIEEKGSSQCSDVVKVRLEIQLPDNQYLVLGRFN